MCHGRRQRVAEHDPSGASGPPGSSAAIAAAGSAPASSIRACARSGNLKSVVLERRGDAIRFNPRILDFAGHYRFLPKPVAIARGNEKGRVEPAIRYIRGSFFAARPWRDIDDLNAQAQAWCEGIAGGRPWPEDRSITVREVFERERGSLITLPGDRFPADERVEVAIGKTAYARFDLNDYSVPHTHVRRTLVVIATLREVRILDDADVIATHPRSFDKGACIEIPEHIAGLARHKRHARRLRGQDRLVRAAPNSERLLTDAAKRGSNLGAIVAALPRLLDEYGAAELEAGIDEALKRGVPHRTSPWRDRDAHPGRRASQSNPERAGAARADPSSRLDPSSRTLRSRDPTTGSPSPSRLDQPTCDTHNRRNCSVNRNRHCLKVVDSFRTAMPE